MTWSGAAFTLAVVRRWQRRLVLLSDRWVLCWGNNDFRQLADGTTHPCRVEVGDARGDRAPRAHLPLRRRIGGVSERMLALTLRTLAHDGFVARRDFDEVPPRVEYSLTPMGRALAKHIETLGRWIATNTPKVLEARRRFPRPR